MKRFWLFGLILLVSITLVAWGRSNSRPATVRVFAAASLRDAFGEIARGFEARHPGVLVEVASGGSQALRVQIEQGAPADVFASADRRHMDALTQEGFAGPSTVFARNRLVIIAPTGDHRVLHPADLARPGTHIVLAAPSVPGGRYADQILAKMQRSGRYGGGFSARVAVNVVSREPDVRAVLAKVALGEADAGMVYASDVRAAGGRVRTVAIPDNLNVTAEYPIAVVRRTTVPRAAEEFRRFVLGPEGQASLRRNGFLP